MCICVRVFISGLGTSDGEVQLSRSEMERSDFTGWKFAVAVIVACWQTLVGGNEALSHYTNCVVVYGHLLLTNNNAQFCENETTLSSCYSVWYLSSSGKMASSSSYFSWNTKRTDETPSDYLNLSTNEVKNIGLVGEARSGKSSFVKAIMRYASLFDSTTMFKLSS